MLAEPNRVSVVFISRFVLINRELGTGSQGVASWRLGDLAPRLAVTFGYVDDSRTRTS